MVKRTGPSKAEQRQELLARILQGPGGQQERPGATQAAQPGPCRHESPVPNELPSRLLNLFRLPGDSVRAGIVLSDSGFERFVELESRRGWQNPTSGRIPVEKP